MPINILTPDIVSKIAAGEVIERPASVVKELVENSLDAGATQIDVETQGGGVKLIKVSDNGAGIPASEVKLAFHRYATSKVNSLADLGGISSLGFRGEALPSIAAVAEVELSSKTVSEAVGSYIHLKEGTIVHKESRSRSQGTTMIVHRLFRYFPARLKFLKSEKTENGHVAQLITQYALAFPEVRFSLLLDGHLSLRTAGNGNLRDVVNEIYGLEMAQGMLELEDKEALLKVSGLASSPSLARSNRNYISFFVNRRWVRSPLLIRAVEEAYHGLLMNGKHPMAIVNISLPVQEVDVNVHPAKAQVKFCHEQAIFAGVEKAIEAALSRMPLARSKAMPFSVTPGQWQSLQTTPQMVKDNEPTFVIAPLPDLGLPALRMLGQLSNTYIIAEGPDGLFLIDQHAAHERILYEKILAQWSKQEVEVQGLLQPITLELSPREEEALKSSIEILTQFGFTIESFGARSYLIRAVPALLIKTDIIEAISTLLDNLATKKTPTSWEERIAQSLACHSAIRAGQMLSSEEMKGLLRQLEQVRQPRACPHGRPTMIHLSSHQLEKEFGRIN